MDEKGKGKKSDNNGEDCCSSGSCGCCGGCGGGKWAAAIFILLFGLLAGYMLGKCSGHGFCFKKGMCPMMGAQNPAATPAEPAQ